jgi:hypothetical protein
MPSRRPRLTAQLADHFFESASVRARTNGAGRALVELACDPEHRAPRFLHVTAGERWPLAETVLPIV